MNLREWRERDLFDKDFHSCNTYLFMQLYFSLFYVSKFNSYCWTETWLVRLFRSWIFSLMKNVCMCSLKWEKLRVLPLAFSNSVLPGNVYNVMLHSPLWCKASDYHGRCPKVCQHSKGNSKNSQAFTRTWDKIPDINTPSVISITTERNLQNPLWVCPSSKTNYRASGT